MSSRDVNLFFGDKVKEMFVYVMYIIMNKIEFICCVMGVGNNMFKVLEKFDASWVSEFWDSFARDFNRKL